METLKRHNLNAEKILFANYAELGTKNVPLNVDLTKVFDGVPPDEENFIEIYIFTFENAPMKLSDNRLSYYKKDEKFAQLFVDQIVKKFSTKKTKDGKEDSVTNTIDVDPDIQDEIETMNETESFINSIIRSYTIKGLK